MDSNKKPAPKRRRARNSDGSYKGDIPGTKQNEAWVADDISTEVGEKEVDYTVRKLIDTSSPTAGKYGRKDPVRPTFGKVRTRNY